MQKIPLLEYMQSNINSEGMWLKFIKFIKINWLKKSFDPISDLKICKPLYISIMVNIKWEFHGTVCKFISFEFILCNSFQNAVLPVTFCSVRQVQKVGQCYMRLYIPVILMELWFNKITAVPAWTAVPLGGGCLLKQCHPHRLCFHIDSLISMQFSDILLL